MPGAEKNKNQENRSDFRETFNDAMKKMAMRFVVAYSEIGILEPAAVQRADGMSGRQIIKNILVNVPNLAPEQNLTFCEEFIGDAPDFNGATKAILAGAYRALAGGARDAKADEKFQRLEKHIDDLCTEFANVKNTDKFVSVYEDWRDLFAARLDVLNQDKSKNAQKISEFTANLEYLETVIRAYNKNWGLAGLRSIGTENLERRWNRVWNAAVRAELSEESKQKASNIKFLDAENKTIIQFVGARLMPNGKLKKFEYYKPGYRFDKNGRAQAILDLARYDVARKNFANLGQKINEDDIEIQVNDEFAEKIRKIADADKIVSDAAYDFAIDDAINQAADWGDSIKQQLYQDARSARGFFETIFQPLTDVNELSDTHTSPIATNKRKKRIDFYTRTLNAIDNKFISRTFITMLVTREMAHAQESKEFSDNYNPREAKAALHEQVVALAPINAPDYEEEIYGKKSGNNFDAMEQVTQDFVPESDKARAAFNWLERFVKPVAPSDAQTIKKPQIVAKPGHATGAKDKKEEVLLIAPPKPTNRVMSSKSKLAVAKIRDVDVNLEKIGPEQSDIVLIDETPVAVVDVRGLRIPFYHTENGWKPLYTISPTNKLYTDNVSGSLRNTIYSPDMAEIVSGLNAKFDAIDKAQFATGSAQELFNVVNNASKNNRTVWKKYPGDLLLAGPRDIDRFLARVGLENMQEYANQVFDSAQRENKFRHKTHEK